MKKKLLMISAAAFLAAAGFTGCAKKAVRTDTGVSMTKAEAVPEAPVKAEEPPAAVVEKAPEPAAVKGLTDVYFDFDRYAVREDGVKTLNDDAGMLISKKEINVVIEGHCDERGTDEYNIALGEKRAQAVKKYLALRGVDPKRIKTVSYGSERPFCAGHSEECWQENRRAHFVSEQGRP